MVKKLILLLNSSKGSNKGEVGEVLERRWLRINVL